MAHHILRIAISYNLRRLNPLPDLRLFLLRQLDVQTRHILIEVLGLRCPRNRNDILALRHQPRKRQLPRRYTLIPRNLRNRMHKLHILAEILFRVPRHGAPTVVGLKVIVTFDLAAEDASTEGTVRDDGNAEFAACGEKPVLLDVHGEGRVLDLHGCNVVHFAGAPKSLGGAFAEPEILDLALVLQLCHCLNGDFDGLLGIDAMTVVQINCVAFFQPQPLMRFCTGLTDVFGVVDHFGGSVRLAYVGEFAAEEDFGPVAGFGEPPSCLLFNNFCIFDIKPYSEITYCPSRSSLSP